MPPRKYDYSQILQLRKSGMETKDIADAIGCSRDVLNAILKRITGIDRSNYRRKGEKSHSRKLGEKEVLEIYKERNKSKKYRMSYSELGEKYSVSPVTIYYIATGETWTDLYKKHHPNNKKKNP